MQLFLRLTSVAAATTRCRMPWNWVQKGRPIHSTTNSPVWNTVPGSLSGTFASLGQHTERLFSTTRPLCVPVNTFTTFTRLPLSDAQRFRFSGSGLGLPLQSQQRLYPTSVAGYPMVLRRDFHSNHRQNPFKTALVSTVLILGGVGAVVVGGAVVISLGGVAILCLGGIYLFHALKGMFARRRPGDFFSYGSSGPSIRFPSILKRPPPTMTESRFQRSIRSALSRVIPFALFNGGRSDCAMDAYDTAVRIVEKSDKVYHLLGARISCMELYFLKINRHESSQGGLDETMEESGEFAFPVSGSKGSGRVKGVYTCPPDVSQKGSAIFRELKLIMDDGRTLNLMGESPNRADTTQNVVDVSYEVKSTRK